jgi:hypothetical protein
MRFGLPPSHGTTKRGGELKEGRGGELKLLAQTNNG